MSHATERAAERYNKNFSSKELYEISRSIYLGKCIHTGITTEDGKFAYVNYQNIPLKCLYKIQNNKVKIITIYPIDVDEYNYLISKEAIESARQLLIDNGYLVI